MAKMTTPWFRHDANATDDPKLVALLGVYGNEGLGAWWRLVEFLRRQPTLSYPITGKYVINALSVAIGLPLDRTEQFLDDCREEFKLLDSKEMANAIHIFSSRLSGSLEDLRALSSKRSKAGKRGAKVRWEPEDSEWQTDSKPIASERQLDSDKIREEEIRGEKRRKRPRGLVSEGNEFWLSLLPDGYKNIPGLSPEWEGWAAMRSRRHNGKKPNPLTEGKAQHAIRMLDKLVELKHDPVEVVRQSKELEWEGFYPPHLEQKNGKMRSESVRGVTEQPGYYDEKPA